MSAQPKRDSRCCYVCRENFSRAKGEIRKLFLRPTGRLTPPRHVWVCSECERLNPEHIETWEASE